MIGNATLNRVRTKVAVATATKAPFEWTISLTREEFSLLKKRNHQDQWIPRNRIVSTTALV